MEDLPFAASPDARATLSFPALMAALWRGRFVVAGFVLASVVAGVITLSVMKPLYTATMLISPKGSSANRPTGIAAFYTSALGLDNGDPNFTLFLQSLESYRLAKALQDKGQLLQKLSPSLWDERAHAWRRPQGAIVDIKSGIKSFLHMPQWTPPDYRDLAQLIRDNTVITHAGVLAEQTSVYQIAYKADDPVLAVDMLNKLYWGAEDIVREQQRADLTTTIAHLHQQLLTETSQDVRAELVRRILLNETQIALLQTNQPAATTIIDSPSIPKNSSFPNPKLTLLFCGILGMLFGLVFGALYGYLGAGGIGAILRRLWPWPRRNERRLRPAATR